jgi:hypothetical protein
MLLHHLATISLISFSYVNNMVRVGTLLMCLHDAVDVLMEVWGQWRGLRPLGNVLWVTSSG